MDPDQSAGLCSEPQISAENCFDLLTTAKREGARGLRDRVYRFMSDHYLQVLRTPPLYGRLSAGERALILERRMEGAQLLAVAETSELSERGGAPPEDPPPPRRVLCLDPAGGGRWEVLTRLPDEVPARGCGICTLYNYLFVAGGMGGPRGGAPSDRVFCFNPRTGTWSQTRPLSQPRCGLRLVPMEGALFAVGGECLLTVERYDPRADRWAPVAPLPKGSFAVAHEATACGGELFVSGGSLLYRLLRYDPHRDEWEESPFNASRRRSADMVAHRSRVYRFDVDRARAEVSVHVYNTVVKAWHGGATFPLRDPRPFRCAVLRDRIYCVNRVHTLQFDVREEEQEGFLQEVLPPPEEARGTLVPFVLSLDRDGDLTRVKPASDTD